MNARPPRVVVSHWVHPEVRAYLAGFCDPVIPARDPGVWSPAQLAELAADAEGIVACMADRIDEPFLARCPRLRVVSATLKGYDNFDARACARRGVWLTIVPGPLIAPTAELAIGLAIGLLRRIADGHEQVRAGGFAGWRPQFYGATLQGATVGVAGLGQLGQAVARRLAGFESRVVYHDARRLARLPRGAYLVNVGRGSVVSEEAVADALESGHLGGYAADVFAMEDWALPGRPDVVPGRLARHPRALFTPHLGSAVDEVRREMSLQAARQVRQVLVEGRRPDHAVSEPAPAAGNTDWTAC
jgi:phosphonate dehydrogenase